MIKNIVFDIGGVLLEYNPQTYLNKLGINDEDKKEINNIVFKSSFRRNLSTYFKTYRIIVLEIKRIDGDNA